MPCVYWQLFWTYYIAVGGNKGAKVTVPWRAMLEVQEGSHGGTAVSSNMCLLQMSVNSQLSSAWRYLTILCVRFQQVTLYTVSLAVACVHALILGTILQSM